MNLAGLLKVAGQLAYVLSLVLVGEEFVKWFISIPLILVVGAALFYSYEYERGMTTPVILFATFIAIVIYTQKTMEMTETTKEMAEQAKRQVDIQTRIYEDSQTPVVSFKIDKRPELSPESWTRVTLANLSNFDTSVWINLNFKVNETPLNVSPPHYTGDEPWNLQAGDVIKAPGFPLTNLFNHLGQSLAQLQQQANSGNLQTKVTLEIEVKFTAYGGRVIEKPVKKYHFHFSKIGWVYDV